MILSMYQKAYFYFSLDVIDIFLQLFEFSKTRWARTICLSLEPCELNQVSLERTLYLFIRVFSLLKQERNTFPTFSSIFLAVFSSLPPRAPY